MARASTSRFSRRSRQPQRAAPRRQPNNRPRRSSTSTRSPSPSNGEEERHQEQNEHRSNQNELRNDEDEEEEEEDELQEDEDNEECDDEERKKYLVYDLKMYQPGAPCRSKTLNLIYFNAKFVGREIHMGFSAHDVITYGPRLRNIPEGQPLEDEELETLSEEECKTFREQFKKLLIIIPCLEDDLKLIGSSVRAISGLIKLINAAIMQARREDCRKLRKAAVSWLPLVLDPEHLGDNSPNIFDETKSGRGFSHISTGRLLVAADDLAKFNEDPEKYCKLVQTVEIVPLADDFPAFFYPQRHYDPDAKDRWALQGEMCSMAYAAVWAGAQAALKAALAKGKKGRSPIGKNRKKITAQKVAYVMVLLRFSLSTQEEWAEVDGNFDNLEFYETIISLFEGDEDWEKATLAHLEIEVWKSTISTGDNQRQRQSASEALAEQRRTRREVPNTSDQSE